MYGWRGRLGLIVPSSNTTNESEFHRHLPDGVSVHTARMHQQFTTVEDLTSMADEADRCAQLLETADVDVIAYGCTTGSLVKGPGHEREIESTLEELTGIPTVATAASIKRAFDSLDLESLVIATPYIDELNEREKEFLEAAGYAIERIAGLGIERNLEIGRQSPLTAYRQAIGLGELPTDGVFISCTNYRTFEIIEPLENDLGRPVVTSNQATLWDAMRYLNVDATDVCGLGRLFEIPPPSSVG